MNQLKFAASALVIGFSAFVTAQSPVVATVCTISAPLSSIVLKKPCDYDWVWDNTPEGMTPPDQYLVKFRHDETFTTGACALLENAEKEQTRSCYSQIFSQGRKIGQPNRDQVLCSMNGSGASAACSTESPENSLIYTFGFDFFAQTVPHTSMKEFQLSLDEYFQTQQIEQDQARVQVVQDDNPCATFTATAKAYYHVGHFAIVEMNSTPSSACLEQVKALAKVDVATPLEMSCGASCGWSNCPCEADMQCTPKTSQSKDNCDTSSGLECRFNDSGNFLYQCALEDSIDPIDDPIDSDDSPIDSKDPNNAILASSMLALFIGALSICF